MDWITILFNQISIYVNIPYLLTFILLSYLAKKELGGWLQKITKFNFKTAYIVLILATVIGILFWIFIKDLKFQHFYWKE